MARNGNGNGHHPYEAAMANLFNQDYERLVLGAILLDDPESPRVFELLDSSDFSNSRHQKVFRRMQAMHKRGEPIDRITLGHEMDAHSELKLIGGLSFLLTLDDGMPANSHPEKYAR